MKLADVPKSAGNATGIKNVNMPFVITAVQDDQYDENTPSVRMTVQPIQVDGQTITEIYTTAKTIVSMMSDPTLRAALAKGETLGPVRKVAGSAKTGQTYYTLQDVEGAVPTPTPAPKPAQTPIDGATDFQLGKLKELGIPNPEKYTKEAAAAIIGGAGQ